MKIFKMFLFATLFTAVGCETFDLDQTVNPSTIGPDQLDPVYSFNYAQLQLPDFVQSANGFTQRVTRQMAMTGGNSYNNGFSPINFDQNWTQAYLILNAIKVSEPRAIENNQTFILGANKVIRAYVLMTLVDIYGDVPYSEALMGNANLTPKFDESADVYAGIYEELNQAIAYLQQPGNSDAALRPRDLYYGTGLENVPSAPSWITLAKTLKFKMLNNSRLIPSGQLGTHTIAAEMQALASEGDLITTTAQDFAFRYGNLRVNPNSRHPLYNDHYELGGGAYIGNYFMWAVSREKEEPSGAYTSLLSYLDPRTKFYFFNQDANFNNEGLQILPCDDENKRPAHYDEEQYESFYDSGIEAAFCTTNLSADASAFWGRDHGDNSGIPLDATKRTVVGLYPAGGAYGTPVAVADSGITAGTKGALGEGIMPIIMSSFVNFMLAEAKLEGMVAGGDTGALENLLLGIRQSLDRSTTPINGYPALSAIDLTNLETKKLDYLEFISNPTPDAGEVLGVWETRPADRLQIIIKEYYIAAWGNGIEPYNNYRRTGFPSNFQPTLEENAGSFFSTGYYPYVSVNNNPNAPSNIRTRKVFWDVAGLTLQ